MMRNFDTTIKADLRKKNSINDAIRFSSINIAGCMLFFGITSIFLLVVMSIVMTPNPYII